MIIGGTAAQRHSDTATQRHSGTAAPELPGRVRLSSVRDLPPWEMLSTSGGAIFVRRWLGTDIPRMELTSTGPMLPGRAIVLRQAREAVSWRDLATLTRTGQLQRLNWRTCAVPAKPTGLTTAQRLAIRIQQASIMLGREAIAYGGSAAVLHGFDIAQQPEIHLTTSDGWSKPLPAPFVLHQCVPRGRPIRVCGVLVTDAGDTAVDVACEVPELDVLAVLDAAVGSGSVTLTELDMAVKRASGRRGIIAVRELLPFAVANAGSPMESRTRFRLINAHVPAPESQVPIRLDSGEMRYVDMGWPRYRIGVDYEGEEFHSGTGAMARDRRRHNALTHLGWRMFYPTAVDIYVGHQAFVEMIGRALAEAGAQVPPNFRR